ncbi:hypothetical protein EX30DRAFT_397463 [Ascodesmis nigricans]|uniref:Uncharacterized protein n=1 Tax=Ascodesmis nigricans TaxID=341454 RepID=A0A4S2MRU6_9PEZI|nr:hypothetical protein EX30DRAFT_397463 [Ascodesmis nigricans]
MFHPKLRTLTLGTAILMGVINAAPFPITTHGTNIDVSVATTGRAFPIDICDDYPDLPKCQSVMRNVKRFSIDICDIYQTLRGASDHKVTRCKENG